MNYPGYGRRQLLEELVERFNTFNVVFLESSDTSADNPKWWTLTELRELKILYNRS